MNRREFTNFFSVAITGIPLLMGTSLFPDSSNPKPLLVNGARLNKILLELAKYGRNDHGGIDRVSFSEADRNARQYVIGLMKNAGLDVKIDAAANIIGRRKGNNADAKPIMLGSHIDSVPSGGNYDGQVGSAAAVEVAQILHEDNQITRHPLEFVIFSNEEGGKTGSRAMAGEIKTFELDIMTASGFTIGEGLRANSGDPDKLTKVKRLKGSIAGFLELHIEQGGILDREGLTIGVVEGIVGIKRWSVTVKGFTNHAGTTPMTERRDSLVAAAQFIQAVHRIAKNMPGRQVATVGKITPEPGAPNVIPGRTSLTLEIRDLDMAKIDNLFKVLVKESKLIGEETGTQFSFDQFYLSKAALTDDLFRKVIEEETEKLGFSYTRMPSGAGHDAQSIAQLAPVGMIFIPSLGGISHSPKEKSRSKDIEAGANVLLQSLLTLDHQLS